MLRFFRQIRQRLLTQNKFSKYLLYAVGEILLVVIGILIALQINNWNEERKELRSEKQILLTLSQDFNANIVALELSIERIPAVIEKYSKVLEYSIRLDSGLTTSMKDTIMSTEWVSTNIVDGALISILDSEKLEVIRSDSLKRMLTSYPELTRHFKGLESDLKDYVVDVQRPIVRSYLTLADLLLDDPRFDEFKQKSFNSDYEGLLRDKEYINIIMGVRSINHVLLRQSMELLERTKKISQVIDHELKR